MRTGMVIISVIAIATVLSEMIGVALLWYRGQLTEQTLSDVRLLLSGDLQSAVQSENREPRELPSTEDYSQQRILRVLGLNTREQELQLLQSMVAANRKAVIDERQSLEGLRDEFEKRLAELKQQTASQSAEQARGILQALQPADAAEQLMALTFEQDVLLLKGMSERSVARILEQMLKGDDAQKERGSAIFEALSQGDPEKSLVEDTQNQLAGQAKAPAN